MKLSSIPLNKLQLTSHESTDAAVSRSCKQDTLLKDPERGRCAIETGQAKPVRRMILFLFLPLQHAYPTFY
jgi:hypothetical protein